MPCVVVVDDSDVFRGILAGVIRDLGHEVIEAKDGKEAFELIRGLHVDLIITDLQMPDWSGYKLLTELRADGKTIPVVLCTAAPESALRHYHNVGFAAVLVKDATLYETLSEAVRKSINRIG